MYPTKQDGTSLSFGDGETIYLLFDSSNRANIVDIHTLGFPSQTDERPGVIPTNYVIIIYNPRPHAYLSSLSLPSSVGSFLERPIGTISHATATRLSDSERALLEVSERSGIEECMHSPAIDLSKCQSFAVTGDILLDLAALGSIRRQ